MSGATERRPDARTSELTAEAPKGASAETGSLPSVPIWKRGPRLAEMAREFAQLFDGARNAGDVDLRGRLTECVDVLADDIAAEAHAMAALLKLAATHPPAPKAPPAKPRHETEE